MNCPICGEEMDRGLIQNSSPLGWIKTEKRTFCYNPDLFEGSLCLSKLSMLKGSAVVAHNCRRCKKIIIDYGDPTSDLNYSQPKAKE
jgi:hypothetical protein